jgi:hypothetical protein
LSFAPLVPWQRATFDTLPVVTEPRERTIDPTVTASADVLLPDGTKVIEAGASVNPLDHVPFTHRLIVFDASDPRQVETARRLGETDSPQRPLYLATRFDRDQGWDGLRTVEDRLCWACLFPVRIAGLPIGGGQVPAGAATSAFCGCATGAGFTIGMWEPARIIELTHAPGCSAALGGSRLPMGSRRLIGTEAETQKAHVIGQSTFTWGESRTIPGPGEHQLYLLWRWSDCCAIYE